MNRKHLVRCTRWLALGGLLVLGCQTDRPGSRRDPLLGGDTARGGDRRTLADRLGWSGNDRARDVSRSPATDDPFFSNERTRDSREDRYARTERDREPDPEGPIPPSLADRKSERESSAGDGDTSFVSASEELLGGAEYAKVRNRLDAIRANFQLRRDPESGNSLFEARVPDIDDAQLIKVFEAEHTEPLKAMVAVTEEAERWVADRRRGRAKP